MARSRRRLAALLLLAAGAFMLLAAAASWLIVRTWGPTLTANRIAAAIAEGTGRPARVDAVDLQPLRGRVRISGLTISGEREPMVRVDQVDVGLRIESLWRLELTIGATARGVDVRLQPDPTAPPPRPFDFPDRFELGPITVHLASVSVEQSRFTFADPAAQLVLRFEGLDAVARPERRGLEVSARVKTFHIRIEDFEEAVDDLAAEVRVDAERVAARRIELRDSRHRIAGTAAIEAPWSPDPTLKGQFEARLALERLAQRLGAAVAVKGTAALDATVSGPLARPVLAGKVAVEALAVERLEGRDLSASLRLDERGLEITDVAGRTLGGRLQGSFAMSLGRPSHAVVKARLDAAEASAVARLGGGASDVRGRLSLDGELRGDLARPTTLAGQVRAEGSDLRLPGELARLGIGRLSASARMADGRIAADAEGRWPAAGATATARMEPDQRMRGEVRARADLSPLTGWSAGDSVELTARAEGIWPQVALTAAAALARPGVRPDAGRVDVRLSPVAGSAPRWDGALRSRRLALPWVELEDLDAGLALTGEAVEVPRVVARVARVPVEGSGRWAWRGHGEARLAAGPVTLARLQGVPPDLGLEGTARAQIEVTATGAGAQGTARLEADRVAIGKVALGRGTGEAALRGRRLDASLRFPERQLEASASGELAPGQVATARLSLKTFDLASLVAAPSAGGTPLLRGAISASADLAVPIDAPLDLRGTLAVQPTGLSVAGSTWASPAAIVARVGGRRAIIEPARLTGPAGAVEVGGVVWDAAARPLVSVKLDAQLAVAAPGKGLGGRARAEAELSGEVGAVAGSRARVRIDGDGLTLPGALAKAGTGTARLEARVDEGVADIARGELSFPAFAVAAGGRVDFRGPVALDVRATARAEPLGAALGVDSSGTATGAATVRGTLSRPDARARLDADRLVVSGVAVERLSASARYDGSALQLERLTARVLGAPLRARGEWTTAGSGRGELEAGPLALDQIAGLPDRLALAGSLSLRAEATMERGALRASASAQAREARAAGLQLNGGRLTARLEGQRLRADLELAERRITGTAAGTLAPGGAIEAALDIAALELTPVVRQLAGRPEADVELTAAGRATARVPWDRPGALVARARFDPITVRSRAAGVDSKGFVAANWDGGRLVLEGVELAGTGGTLRASGALEADGRLDAKVDARMLLAALLAPVADVSGAEGTVVVQAHASGTLAEPSLRGEGSLTNGRIAVRGLGALRDIDARVTATPGTIRIADATAALGAGTIRATGEAALSGTALSLYRVRVTARDVPLRPLDGLDTLWNADLELGGAGDRSLLSGEARLVRGTYSRDLVSLSALTAPEQAAAAAKGTGIPLNVRASLDDNLLIRTTMARMRVGGTLTIRGTTTAPIVLGVLEARDGTLILRGQRYQLERAVVRFADPRRIDPLLDVTATTRIQDYDVTMRVTGHVRDLDMRLSSSPSLSRDQLLSLVAFGSPGGESALGAGGAVAGEAAGLVIRELLDASGGGENTLPAPLRAIMERTRVSYTHNSEDIGRFGLRVEYEVTGPFLLAGERTSQGYYVIDGVVRLRFR